MQNITIQQEKKSTLLHRREIIATLHHAGTMTPKNADVKKALAEHYKTAEDLISLHSLRDRYGTTECVISASVYDTPEAYKTYALVSKKAKKKEGDGAPAAQPGKK